MPLANADQIAKLATYGIDGTGMSRESADTLLANKRKQFKEDGIDPDAPNLFGDDPDAAPMPQEREIPPADVCRRLIRHGVKNPELMHHKQARAVLKKYDDAKQAEDVRHRTDQGRLDDGVAARPDTRARRENGTVIDKPAPLVLEEADAWRRLFEDMENPPGGKAVVMKGRLAWAVSCWAMGLPDERILELAREFKAAAEADELVIRETMGRAAAAREWQARHAAAMGVDPARGETYAEMLERHSGMCADDIPL